MPRPPPFYGGRSPFASFAAVPRASLLPRDLYLYAVAAVQAALCAAAFAAILAAPAERVLYGDYDGAKNYFTPYAFTTDLGTPAAGAHPLKVYGQHYPFSENVFYADNTPAVALAGRALYRAGAPLRGGGVGWLSYVIIGFQWAAGVVAYLLLRRFVRPRWLAATLALCTVWGAKQYWHLSMGSPNLSLVAFSVGLIGLMWLIWRGPLRWRGWLGAAVLIAGASWFHLYYLLVYGSALAFFAVALLVAQAAWPEYRGAPAAPARSRSLLGRLRALWPAALRAGVAGGVALLLVYVPILLIDDKLALRTGEMLGYGYEAWRTDLRSLFTPRPEYRAASLVSHVERFHGERSGYLGLWFLYAVLLGVVHALAWPGSLRAAARLLGASREGRFLVALGAVGTACFFASLGKEYTVPGGSYTWHVLLNPFYPFVSHSTTLQHFRAVARFLFVTQWAWAVPVAFFLGVLWRRHAWSGLRGAAVRLAIVGVVCAGLVDLRDVVRARARQADLNPMGPTATAGFAEAHTLAQGGDYQALMVLPYFHVGAQAPGLIIDPVSHVVQREAFTLAAATRLPLVNAITSRTPPHEARHLMRLALAGAVSDSLRAASLTEQPLLVAVHRPSTQAIAGGVLAAGYYAPPAGLARETVLATPGIVARLGAAPLAQVGDYDFYRWRLGDERAESAPAPE